MWKPSRPSMTRLSKSHASQVRFIFILADYSTLIHKKRIDDCSSSTTNRCATIYWDNIGHTMMLTRRTVSLCQHPLVLSQGCDGDDYEFVVYRNTRPCIRKREANDRNYYGYNWYKFVTLFQWWQRYPDGSLSPVINSVTVLVIHFPCLEGRDTSSSNCSGAPDNHCKSLQAYHDKDMKWMVALLYYCNTKRTPHMFTSVLLLAVAAILDSSLYGDWRVGRQGHPQNNHSVTKYTLTIKSSWVMLYVTWKLLIHPQTHRQIN